MEAKEVYQIIEKNSLPLMSAYQTDLTKIDRECIEDMPKLYGKLVPFVHITRDWGTHIDEFWPVESYPAPGQYIPYLFGNVDRDGLVDRAGANTEYFASHRAEEVLLVQYFDGDIVQTISLDRAVELFTKYRQGMRDFFRI